MNLSLLEIARATAVGFCVSTQNFVCAHLPTVVIEQEVTDCAISLHVVYWQSKKKKTQGKLLDFSIVKF